MKKETFPLDNAASIFPCLIGKVAMAIWRVSVTLKEKINPELLLKALNNTIIRFPCFAVKLKKGGFWYRFEKNLKPLIIHADPRHPCVGMNYKKENNGYLFAVKYFEKQIAIEGFHSLSDGYGGLVFLKNLVAEYLRICGNRIEFDEENQIFNLSLPQPAEEFEDAYKRYYKTKNEKRKTKNEGNPIKKTFHLCKGQKRHQLQNIIIGTMCTKAVAKLAKSQNCTVGELLFAVYTLALTKIRLNSEDENSVITCIPINLRSIFPTKSLRNFSQVAHIIIDELKEYTFEEILNQVKTQIKPQLEKENLQAVFSKTVAIELNPFTKAVPLFIKEKIMSKVYLSIGERGVTAALSNLGRIILPESMSIHIDKFCVNTVAGYLNPKACGVVTFGEKLCVSFTSTVDDNELERLFFTFFTERGIDVSVESNMFS